MKLVVHEGLKIPCWKACRFDSDHPHQHCSIYQHLLNGIGNHPFKVWNASSRLVAGTRCSIFTGTKVQVISRPEEGSRGVVSDFATSIELDWRTCHTFSVKTRVDPRKSIVWSGSINGDTAGHQVQRLNSTTGSIPVHSTIFFFWSINSVKPEQGAWAWLLITG